MLICTQILLTDSVSNVWSPVIRKQLLIAVNLILNPLFLNSKHVPWLNVHRSALEYCQEAAAILEQLSDRVADEDDQENFPSSFVQDRLATAYLWLALMEHKSGVEEKATAASPELSESFEAEEVHKSFFKVLWQHTVFHANSTWSKRCLLFPVGTSSVWVSCLIIICSWKLSFPVFRYV